MIICSENERNIFFSPDWHKIEETRVIVIIYPTFLLYNGYTVTAYIWPFGSA